MTKEELTVGDLVWFWGMKDPEPVAVMVLDTHENEIIYGSSHGTLTVLFKEKQKQVMIDQVYKDKNKAERVTIEITPMSWSSTFLRTNYPL